MSETQSAPAPTTEAPATAAPAAPAVQPTAPASQAPTSERPSWLPEKFTSPEALAEAYSNLEKKLGSAPPATPEAPKQEAPKFTPAPPDAARQAAEQAGLPDPGKLNDQDLQFILAQRGLNPQKIADEYLTNGALSAETYASLDKSGLPKVFVDGWITGRELQAEKFRARLYTEVGGEQEFTQVQSWARANLQPQAIKAFNDAIAVGDEEMMALAVRGLHARYIAAVGNRPTLIGGDATAGAVEGYGSQAEVVAAMADPRYRKDASYRGEVERKLAARPILNTRVTR